MTEDTTPAEPRWSEAEIRAVWNPAWCINGDDFLIAALSAVGVGAADVAHNWGYTQALRDAAQDIHDESYDSEVDEIAPRWAWRWLNARAELSAGPAGGVGAAPAEGWWCTKCGDIAYDDACQCSGQRADPVHVQQPAEVCCGHGEADHTNIGCMFGWQRPRVGTRCECKRTWAQVVGTGTGSDTPPSAGAGSLLPAEPCDDGCCKNSPCDFDQQPAATFSSNLGTTQTAVMTAGAGSPSTPTPAPPRDTHCAHCGTDLAARPCLYNLATDLLTCDDDPCAALHVQRDERAERGDGDGRDPHCALPHPHGRSNRCAGD